MASESTKNKTQTKKAQTPNEVASNQKKKDSSTKVVKEKKTQTTKTNKTGTSTKKKTASTKKVVPKTKEKEESKKVVVKEKVKPISEVVEPAKEKAEKKIVAETKEKAKPKKQEIGDIREHFGVYLLLLSTVLICLHVMGRFELKISTVTVGFSTLLFPTVYFISNIITKKFDFKKTIVAVLTSSIAMVLFVYLSKYLNAKVVDYFVIYGEVFAYIISQLLNLLIYYYLLVNTELKARWIYLTYLFSIMAYHFIAILFSTRIIITDTFWITFFCSVVLSAIIAIMYGFYDCMVPRGQDI